MMFLLCSGSLVMSLVLGVLACILMVRQDGSQEPWSGRRHAHPGIVLFYAACGFLSVSAFAGLCWVAQTVGEAGSGIIFPALLVASGLLIIGSMLRSGASEEQAAQRRESARMATLKTVRAASQPIGGPSRSPAARMTPAEQSLLMQDFIVFLDGVTPQDFEQSVA